MKYTAPFTDEDERACIRRAQTGDLDSFGCLVEKYKSLLKGYCIDTLHCPFERAEDIELGAFCMAWETIATYIYDAAFFNWLCTLAHNQYVNTGKGRNNQPQAFEEQTVPFLTGHVNKNAGRDCVEGQLKQVRSEYCDLIDYVHLRDMSLKTVAGMQGVPVSTIKSRLVLALKEAGTLVRKCV